MNIRWIGSPNFTKGRGSSKITTIVVHHMVGTLASTDSVFQNRERNTSAHYGVGRDGSIHQYVSESDTAYHAGNFPVNQRSIGIEHEDLGRDEFTDLEYQVSAELIRSICNRNNLAIDAVTIRPHHEFTATACPGLLDINRLITLAKGEEMLPMKPEEERSRYVEVLGREPEPGAKLGQRTELQFFQDAVPEIKTAREEAKKKLKDMGAAFVAEAAKVADLNKEIYRLGTANKALEEQAKEAQTKLEQLPDTALENYSLGALLQAAFKKTFKIK